MNDSKSLLSRRDFLSAGALTIAGLSLAGCDTGAILGPDADSYDLNVGFAEYTIDGLRVRTRTYNGTVPGPTLYTAPGRRLRINIHNQLPPNPPPGDGGAPGGGHSMAAKTRGDMAEHPENDAHSFNTTNLHVHGLQVRPHLFEPLGNSNPSSLMIGIDPGRSLTYDFQVPDNQPSGLYWYHPHHHGSTALQVYNGMAGLIVVRGPIDQVPEIRAAREQFVAVQRLRISPTAEDPDVWGNNPIAYEPPDQGGFTESQKRNYFLVNGYPVAYTADDTVPTIQRSVETYSMQPGEVVRYRFLNGTDAQLMPIYVEGHTMHVIAYDGVNLASPQELDQVEVPPGGRVEFLLKAKAAGSYAFRMAPCIGEQFQDSDGFLIANISVSGAALDMRLPTSLPLAQREYPIIPDSEIVGTQNLHFHSVFPFPELLVGVGFKINDKLYSQQRIDHTVRRGTAEEWTLTAASDEGHPFHLHVNSFWVMEVNGVPLDPPVVKDVVWIPKGGSVKIRARFMTWTGKSVYHCHILFHEDTGMMQNFMILP